MFRKTCLLLLFFLLVSCVNAGGSTDIFIIPKAQSDGDCFYISELNLKTGVIRKTKLAMEEEISIDKVVGLNSGHVFFIGTPLCGPQEGYGYFFNAKTKKVYSLDFRASHTGAINLAQSDTHLIISYEEPTYLKGIKETRLYDSKTFKLISELNNEYGKVVGVDSRCVYYSNMHDVVICSIKDGQEISRLTLCGECISVINGKAVVQSEKGGFMLVDLVTKKQLKMKDNVDIDLSEDGKWAILSEYKAVGGVRKYTGKITICDLTTEREKSVNITPLIINNHFQKRGDARVIQKDKLHLVGDKKLAIVSLNDGKVVYKALNSK